MLRELPHFHLLASRYAYYICGHELTVGLGTTSQTSTPQTDSADNEHGRSGFYYQAFLSHPLSLSKVRGSGNESPRHSNS